MADLENIIATAVADAGGGESTPDPIDSGAEGETTPETDPAITPDPTDGKEPVTPDPADTSGDPDPAKEPAKQAEIDPATGKPKVEEKPAEKSQVEKDLEELGFKAPKDGERENRLPHSRVKKLTENYGKKVEARVRAEFEPIKTEHAALKQVEQNVQNVDRLIATDPERYIGMLAAIHPEYKRFLTPGAPAPKEGEKPAEKPASTLGPKPGPDVKFEDGSQGYSPEQMDKRDEWVAAKAKEEAVAEAEDRFTKRFGKIEERYNASETSREQVQKVRQITQELHETWGKELVEKHEAEIITYMKANPTVSVKAATRNVLQSKLMADRNKIREELLAETRERPAAAARTVPAASSTAKTPSNEPKTLEQVIAESVATLKH